MVRNHCISFVVVHMQLYGTYESRLAIPLIYPKFIKELYHNEMITFLDMLA
jgi:hypothetical protein